MTALRFQTEGDIRHPRPPFGETRRGRRRRRRRRMNERKKSSRTRSGGRRKPRRRKDDWSLTPANRVGNHRVRKRTGRRLNAMALISAILHYYYYYYNNNKQIVIFIALSQ